MKKEKMEVKKLSGDQVAKLGESKGAKMVTGGADLSKGYKSTKIAMEPTARSSSGKGFKVNG